MSTIEDCTSCFRKNYYISISDADPKIAALAFEPAPLYSEQSYSTTYYLSSDVEREVFALRKIRQSDAPLKEVLEAICEVTGLPIMIRRSGSCLFNMSRRCVGWWLSGVLCGRLPRVVTLLLVVGIECSHSRVQAVAARVD